MKEEIPTIRGIKVAYGAGAMLDYVRLFPPDVSVFTGNAIFSDSCPSEWRG